MLVLLSLAPALLRAQPPAPPEVAAELPGARLQGQARMRFFGMRIYDAQLWSTARLARDDGWTQAPLALEIEYARSLNGRAIAERSVQEMKRQAALTEEQAARWLSAMAGIFPDVKPGDRITAVHRPGEGARFFFNRTSLGEIRDALFARLFFGIWLSTRTSEPAFRDALLPASPP
jgi:hypothetical protein